MLRNSETTFLGYIFVPVASLGVTWWYLPGVLVTLMRLMLAAWWGFLLGWVCWSSLSASSHGLSKWSRKHKGDF